MRVSRGKDRRVDVGRLVRELVGLRVNTYSWLVHDRDTDWQDFKLFLPLARAQGIKVWLTLVPPTESPPNNKMFSEPFRLDYECWAVEIAKLSVTEPSLIAWSIDDFTQNVQFFTPEKLRGIVKGARDQSKARVRAVLLFSGGDEDFVTQGLPRHLRRHPVSVSFRVYEDRI